MGYFERDPQIGGMEGSIHTTGEKHVVGNTGDPEFARKLAMGLVFTLGLSVSTDGGINAKQPEPVVEVAQKEVNKAALQQIEVVPQIPKPQTPAVVEVAKLEQPKAELPKEREQTPEEQKEVLPYATDEELMAAVGAILKNVDYKEGIHRNLVSGTVIIELKDGQKVAGVVVGPNMALVPTVVADMLTEVKVIRGGAPFQARKSRWEAGENIEVKKNVVGDLALITFGEELFPAETGLTFEPKELTINERTPIIICANPTGMEARSRAGALLGKRLDTNHFEVKIAANKGLLGGLVTGMSGEILGLIESVKGDTVILRTIDEYESFDDLKKFEK